MGTIRAEHLSASQVGQIRDGNMLWKPQLQKDGRAPWSRVCYSNDLVSRFSQDSLSDASGEKLLSCVSLEPVVRFYLIDSINPAVDLISFFALAIRKLRTEFSAYS